MKNYMDYTNKGVKLVSNKKKNLKLAVIFSFCTVTLLVILLANKTDSKVKASTDTLSVVDFDTLSEEYNYNYKR